MEGNLELRSPLVNLIGNQVVTISDTSISTSTNIDYNDYNNRHKIQGTTLLKHEVSDDLTTTTLEVALQPTTWVKEPITIDYQLITSPGHTETTGKIMFGEKVTIDFKEDLSYVYNDDIFEIRNNMKATIPHLDMDFTRTYVLRLTHNEFFLNSKREITSEPDSVATIEARWDLGREIMARIVFDVESIKASLDASYNKIADGNYKVSKHYSTTKNNI